MLKRFSDKNIGRLLSNKNIGSRFYYIKQNDWDTYSNDISNRYSPNFIQTQAYTNNASNSIVCDNLFVNLNNDIKNLRMNILNLHSRINKLTNIVDKNHNEFDEKLFMFAVEVKKIIDDIPKK